MKLKHIFSGDRVIWVMFFLLSMVSLVEVYSSIGLEAYTHGKFTPTGLFLKHLAIVIATYVAAILLAKVNYQHFAHFARLGYAVVIALLGLSLVLQGRWLRIPIIGQFQPSEILKVVLVVVVARWLALNKDKLDDLSSFITILIIIGGAVALVFPGNFSTAALIFLSCYLMLYFGGINRKYWWRLFLVGVAAVGIFLFYSYYQYERTLNDETITSEQFLQRQSTWGHRVYSWINPNPDELSQENMAKMAIARGGIIGKGPGNTIHARLMTQSHNDFIYAIIIEEFGMLGGLIVFGFYCTLYIRCIVVAGRCRGRFGSLLVAGMGTMIFLQAIVNMSVAVGLLPVTGQTLPFVSYGGTAYLFLGCGVGMIQAVAADEKRQRKREVQVAEQASPTSSTDEEDTLAGESTEQRCIKVAPSAYQSRLESVLVRSWYGLRTDLIRSWKGQDADCQRIGTRTMGSGLDWDLKMSLT